MSDETPAPELGVATIDDLPQLVTLLGVLFEEEADFVPNAAKQRRALEAILSDPRIGRIYVAKETAPAVDAAGADSGAGKNPSAGEFKGARVVGMVSTLYTISTAEGGMAAWLEDLVVLPEYRGRGVGSALLSYAIGAAREAGVLRMTLLSDEDNALAHAVYASEGFQFSGMRPMRLKL